MALLRRVPKAYFVTLPVGDSSQDLESVRGSASGSLRVAGSSNQTTRSVTGNASALLAIKGNSSQALRAVTGTALGSLTFIPIAGNSNQVLGAIFGSGFGSSALPPIIGNSSQRTGTIIGSASGFNPFSISPTFTTGTLSPLDKPLRSVANKLIAKFGHSATLLRQGQPYYNVVTGMAVEQQLTYLIRAVPEEFKSKEIQNGLARVGDRKLLVASASLPFTLSEKDKVIFEGVTHNLVDIASIYSGELPAVVTLHLRK